MDAAMMEMIIALVMCAACRGPVAVPNGSFEVECPTCGRVIETGWRVNPHDPAFRDG